TFVLFAGADAGVKVQLLPQIDIDAPKSLADRCGNRSLESNTIVADRFQDAIRDFPFFLDDLNSAFLYVPVHLHASGVDTAARGLGDFGTNSISTDQRNVIHCWCFLSLFALEPWAISFWVRSRLTDELRASAVAV